MRKIQKFSTALVGFDNVWKTHSSIKTNMAKGADVL